MCRAIEDLGCLSQWDLVERLGKIFLNFAKGLNRSINFVGKAAGLAIPHAQTPM